MDNTYVQTDSQMQIVHFVGAIEREKKGISHPLLSPPMDAWMTSAQSIDNHAPIYDEQPIFLFPL